MHADAAPALGGGGFTTRGRHGRPSGGTAGFRYVSSWWRRAAGRRYWRLKLIDGTMCSVSPSRVEPSRTTLRDGGSGWMTNARTAVGAQRGLRPYCVAFVRRPRSCGTSSGNDLRGDWETGRLTSRCTRCGSTFPT